MMKRSLLFAALLATMAVSSCAYPASTIVQGGVSSSLNFAEMPPEATIVVDGRTIGKAQDYSGANVLAVTPGTHHVLVQHLGRSLVDRDFYVGRESTVKVAAQ